MSARKAMAPCSAAPAVADGGEAAHDAPGRPWRLFDVGTPIIVIAVIAVVRLAVLLLVTCCGIA
jgi:hypothetical protein